ncbi:MAG: hypothetical protein L0241_13715 [Planctomycetia bacterium]|nr:hypothetical protein [Planctomycetia bacterium]
MMAKAKKQTMTLVASKEKNPAVEVKAGQELRVVSVKMGGPDLGKLKRVGATLCGGTSTCLAIVDIGSEVINP